MNGETERMWVVVDFCDDDAGLLFGRLDNGSLLGTVLHVGDEIAVSYDKVVEHRKAWGTESSRLFGSRTATTRPTVPGIPPLQFQNHRSLQNVIRDAIHAGGFGD